MGEFLATVGYLNFVVNALIFVYVLFANKVELKRLRKLLDILDNGGYRSCPYYKKSDRLGIIAPKIHKKGGEDL